MHHEIYNFVIMIDTLYHLSSYITKFQQVRRQAQQLAVHRRFYASLALQDLVQEVPLDEVACKFGASRGVLQALQQSAATFAGKEMTLAKLYIQTC